MEQIILYVILGSLSSQFGASDLPEGHQFTAGHFWTQHELMTFIKLIMVSGFHFHRRGNPARSLFISQQDIFSANIACSTIYQILDFNSVLL